MRQLQPQRLDATFVVLDPTLAATPVAVHDGIYAELDERFAGFAGCSLIACHSFTEDWPTREIHPKGDELVCLLSGEADMILFLPDGDASVRLSEPGSYVIVPRNTWHTAKISMPTTMVFFTPGEGTLNEPLPG